MKKVLVTGADGFIGSHLTEMLVAKGYKVKNGHRQALTEIIVEKVSEKVVKAKPTKKSAEDKSSKTKKAAPKAKSKK